MHETRRNSHGQELGPRLFDDRSYDERQINVAAGEVSTLPDTLDGRIDVFLRRWHWRGPRDVVTKELHELIAFAKGQA